MQAEIDLEVEAVPEATESVSIKDRIEAATLENYKEVLAEIAIIKDAVAQAIYVGMLARVLGVSRGVIAKELKLVGLDDSEGENFRPDMRAIFPGLVDVVQSDSGKIRYLIKVDGKLELQGTWQDSEGNTFRPPEAQYTQFLLPNAERVMSIYSDSDDKELFEDLTLFFKRFSYLEDGVWSIIILSVILSYLQDHPDVRYIPVIYFYAVAERGKSKTAKTMLATSYRGLHLADIRPANVFRFAQHWNATLFFDVTDLWKSAEKSDGQDILLGRFEKGTRLARVNNPDKGAFADQTFFDIYGSTIVATNEPANITFESRCLSITMPNKPGEYENLSPEMALPYKERLTAFRAKMLDQHLPLVETIPGISGRLWEISKPLFQLAKMIAPEAYEPMKKVILEMAGQKIEDKKDTVEGQLVAAIASLAVFDGNLPEVIPVETIRTKVNFGKSIQFHVSPQKLGKRIQSLSINTKKINGYSQAVITAQQLDILKEQYGLTSLTTPEEALQLSTTPPMQEVPDNYAGSGSVESGGESQRLEATLEGPDVAHAESVEETVAPKRPKPKWGSK